MKDQSPEFFEVVTAAGETASIVIAARPTTAARLAACEFRYHVFKITGRVLPIRDDAAPDDGRSILVGESEFTRRAGLRRSEFAEQEYLIEISSSRITLLGRDEAEAGEASSESGIDTNYTRLEDTRRVVRYSTAVGEELRAAVDAGEVRLPGPYDEQGTCYAVYDILERFCDVRWFGPGAGQMTCPRLAELKIRCGKIRRSPALKYRMGTPTWDWPMMKAQWGDPSAEAVALYFRRLRVGGEKWAANHSFRSYQDRFRLKNPVCPELFERPRPEFFAHSQSGGSDALQLCYTNEALIQQVAQDARDYFEGKGLKGQQVALGDYFALVPLDNSAWCQCAACQAQLARDADNAKGGHFHSGTASHYWFGFVNAVARETKRTHPGKFIATLAYHVYAIRPTDLEIEPNVAVAPCLQVRNYWAPRIAAHEAEIHRQWTEPRDRPIHVWNYLCFPEEAGFLTGKWKCFPGFSAHRLAAEISRYGQGGVRGVFLCGLGEQLDFYLTLKLQDDPTLSVDDLLAEFFTRYFGAAAGPMQRFYRLIEETYSEPRNYPADLVDSETQLHQTEEIAWKYLGTESRMAELAEFICEAEALARPGDEARRVQQWRAAVWEHMLDGLRAYLAKAQASQGA